MSEIKGLNKLHKQFAGLEKLRFIEGSVEGAEIIVKYSKKLTPVDTGNLRDSQKVVKTKEGAEIQVNADYAFAVEFGTSKMEAQPFLRPAIDKHMKQVIVAMHDRAEQEITDEVEKWV